MADGGQGLSAYGLPPGPAQQMNSLGHPLHQGGLINSPIPGRTDQLRISVAPESHIIPADIVSALGQGNTMAGAQMLDQMLGMNFARGGKVAGLGEVPIVAAGGEYNVPPEVVKRLGGGDVDKGHKLLDQMITRVRGYTAKRLKKLPPPKK